MPLTQAALATKIKDNLETEIGNVADDPNQMDKFAQAIAKAVIDEIQANAVVSTTGTATVSGGSSAGSHPTASTGGIS